MNKIVSVDPGNTTGIAVAKYELKLDIVDVKFDRLNSFASSLPGVEIMELLPDILLIERSPDVFQGKNPNFDRIVSTIGAFSVNTRIKVFAPGDWKPVARARGWKCKNAKNEHERDAYNLLRYYFWKEHKTDIGDVT